jgi:hypothetical protein
MGDPTSSYATAGIALRVSGALKPHHHDKVETPSVGIDIDWRTIIKWILEKQDGMLRTGFIWPRVETSRGFFLTT